MTPVVGFRVMPPGKVSGLTAYETVAPAAVPEAKLGVAKNEVPWTILKIGVADPSYENPEGGSAFTVMLIVAVTVPPELEPNTV
jgi:hypothetical protein